MVGQADTTPTTDMGLKVNFNGKVFVDSGAPEFGVEVVDDL